jgi:hypothetical protein
MYVYVLRLHIHMIIRKTSLIFSQNIAIDSPYNYGSLVEINVKVPTKKLQSHLKVSMIDCTIINDMFETISKEDRQ